MPSTLVPVTVGRVALIGNYTPRRCGIATFTHDLRAALRLDQPETDHLVVAMTDRPGEYDYPPDVAFEIVEGDRAAYAAAADYLNSSSVDLVVLQHEFGIFGGPAGDYLLDLLRRLRMPVVTTLHTVLTDPDADQRRVMESLIARSATLIVMAEKGREILETRYGVPPSRIAVIPHGVPDQPFLDGAMAKTRLGHRDRDLLLTFGLLSPGKGIEGMLAAMPAIVSAHPHALYMVLGATHPNLKRAEGERYRQSLEARAQGLGIADHVTFIDAFVDEPQLIEYLTAADVYVTPYLNEAQITSGTLAISFGMGKPIVSTPYWHAVELLADGRGVLVPFSDPPALTAAIDKVLADRRLRDRLRTRAYAAGRATIWPTVARRHHETFTAALAARLNRPANVVPFAAGARATETLPAMSLTHLELLTDGVGIAQHSVLAVPDREHGYCLDDNGRALLFLAEQQRNAPWSASETRLALTYAAFVQHAWRPERARFHNFMSYSREWLDEVGADDAHGRTVWALGALVERGGPRHLGDWALALLLDAAPPILEMGSPRAWAYGMLGADAFLRRFPGHRELSRLRLTLAERLSQRLADATGPDWIWFEDQLAYDNARLPQALFEAGAALGRDDLTRRGLEALAWLMEVQTAPGGHFRAVGSDSFGRNRLPPLPFDQQALEVQSAVGACLSAHALTGETRWQEEAHRAFAWFMGANDLRVMMTDANEGAGFDGLHPDRRNANQGAESTLAYLHSLSDMHAEVRAESGDGIAQVA